MKKILTILLSVLMVATLGIVNVSAATASKVDATYSATNTVPVATITKSAAEEVVLDSGSAANFSLSGSDTELTVSARAGLDAGKYTVKYTVDGVAASVDVEISKATPSLAYKSNTEANLVYGKTTSTSALLVQAKANEETETVTYTVTDKDSKVVYSDNTMPKVGTLSAGTYKVTWSIEASTNYEAKSDTVTVVINKAATGAPSTNAGELIADTTYTGSAISLIKKEPTVADRTVEYAVTDTNTAPTTGFGAASTITKTEPGTYYVWYRVAANDNYAASEAVAVGEGPVKITKASQSLTWNTTTTIDNATYGDEIVISGVTGNKTVVTYLKDEGADTVTVVGDKIKLGTTPVSNTSITVKVKAVAVTDTHYNASKEVEKEYTITVKNKATSSLVWNDYGDQTATYGTVSSFANPAVTGGTGKVTYTVTIKNGTEDASTYFIVNTKTPSIQTKATTPAGTYNVTIVANDPGNKNVLAGEKTLTYTITVNKAASTYVGTITPATANALTYNGSAQAVIKDSAKLNGVSTTSFDYAVVSGKVTEVPSGTTFGTEADAKVTGAGDYTIISRLQGDDNHEDRYAFTTFNVGKLAVTVKTAPVAKSWTANGKAYDLVTAAEPSSTLGTVVYGLGTKDKAPDTLSTDIPQAKAAGTYYVWYYVVSDDNINGTELKSVKVVVSAPATSGSGSGSTGSTGTKTTTTSKAVVNTSAR